MQTFFLRYLWQSGSSCIFLKFVMTKAAPILLVPCAQVQNGRHFTRLSEWVTHSFIVTTNPVLTVPDVAQRHHAAQHDCPAFTFALARTEFDGNASSFGSYLGHRMHITCSLKSLTFALWCLRIKHGRLARLHQTINSPSIAPPVWTNVKHLTSGRRNSMQQQTFPACGCIRRCRSLYASQCEASLPFVIVRHDRIVDQNPIASCAN